MIRRNRYLDELIAHKDQKAIKVITGLRRSGKSTLLDIFQQYLLEKSVDSRAILHIKCESFQYCHIRNGHELSQLIRTSLVNNKKNYLLVDEITGIENWGKAISSLYGEWDLDVYFTTSCASRISAELSAYFPGQYVVIRMLPLSFSEYFSHNTDSEMSKEELFCHYMRYGGLPQLCSLPADHLMCNGLLDGIYHTVLLQDVIHHNKIKDIDLLKQIILFLCSHIGSVVSANSISRAISKASHSDRDIRPGTILNYLSMLENAFIVYRSDRYDIKGKEVLKSLEKYYVVDPGIRNSILGYPETDCCRMLENIVYLELLRRGNRMYIGKYDSFEIDFVAINQDGNHYYQITESLSGESDLQQALRSLELVKDNYEKTILTMDKGHPNNRNGIKIRNIIDFLLEERQV